MMHASAHPAAHIKESAGDRVFQAVILFFSVLLMLIGAGVYLIVRVSVVWDSFQKLLEEGDYSRKSKRTRNGVLAGIYWSVVTAGYLACSFLTMKWERTWIIWPVAGVLYAAIVKIEEALLARNQ